MSVVSVNLQPEHKAVLEGSTEILLTEQDVLPMPVNDITLTLRPNSFFQTNTAVAAALYRQARDWVEEVDPRTVLDLYSGVGGFALHATGSDAASVREVLGLEVSANAVASATRSAAQLTRRHPAIGPVSFRVADATEVADQHLVGWGRRIFETSGPSSSSTRRDAASVAGSPDGSTRRRTRLD